MDVAIPNRGNISFYKPGVADLADVFEYFQALSEETKKRFAPHAFDQETIRAILSETDEYTTYVGKHTPDPSVIAYTIVKKGYLEHDRPRLESWGFIPDRLKVCAIAPSVADKWQGCGLGADMFRFILEDLKASGFQRIFLWGGVQAANERAVRFYLRNGFQILGEFEYYGPNYDMMLEIR